MANKHLSFYIDEELLLKLHMVADYEGRSASGQVNYIIRKCVEQFEKEHGDIEIAPKKANKTD